jgi:hypothetical protein
MSVKFNLNSKEIISAKINKENIFDTFTKTIKVKDLLNSNIFNVTKEGS